VWSYSRHYSYHHAVVDVQHRVTQDGCGAAGRRAQKFRKARSSHRSAHSIPPRLVRPRSRTRSVLLTPRSAGRKCPSGRQPAQSNSCARAISSLGPRIRLTTRMITSAPASFRRASCGTNLELAPIGRAPANPVPLPLLLLQCGDVSANEQMRLIIE